MGDSTIYKFLRCFSSLLKDSLESRSIEYTGKNSYQTVTYSGTSPLSLVCALLSSVLSIILALLFTRFRHFATLILIRSNTDPRGAR